MGDMQIVVEERIVAFSGAEVARIPWAERAGYPVRVEQKDGVEAIIYEAGRMREGEPYFVEWYGQKCALVKRDGAVTLMAEDEI